MKKRSLSILAAAAVLFGCNVPKPEYSSVDEYPVPTGSIEELTYTARKSTFSVWSPDADSVMLHIYDQGLGGEKLKSVRMKRRQEGLWQAVVNEDLQGRFYTFKVKEGGRWLHETPGIFAKAVGVNGRRGAVIDMALTNPDGWSDDVKPELQSTNDAIIYEMHWRDFSADASSGLSHAGKYLCLTDEGGVSGIEHLKELGVTHIHIMPSFDYASVDEAKLDEPQYNWGYDPQNYNVPDGSYSTDPFDPACRIREFKQMVMAAHQAGIRVVMDVVYNHVCDVKTSPFELTAPGYFFRTKADSTLANGSGCGNETASDRPMMRKYMVESIKYWMSEYHIDGFRFDLMGIHDIETMNAIHDAAADIDPMVLIYGEGWAAEAPAYPAESLAMKDNTSQLNGIAAFSDEMRDALRGPFWSDEKGAFLIGEAGHEDNIKFGMRGAIDGWAAQPSQMIAYVSCHDDMCLVDRLHATAPKANADEIVRLDKLAQTAVLTSQGIPFIFCGEEIMRDKKGVHNSYCSPDSVNAIDWTGKDRHRDVFEYYSALIAMRKAHKAFHMGSAELVRDNVSFLEAPACVVACHINGAAVGDAWSDVIVILNSNRKAVVVDIPEGQYSVVCSSGRIDLNGLDTLKGSKVTVAPQGATIMWK